MASTRLCVLLLAIGHVHAGAPRKQYDTVVSFGDANTDTGNVYQLTNHRWPPVPPYYAGRFSNGPVWIERLGISDLHNYAYGDATIDNDNLLPGHTGPNGTTVPGIRQQIVAYLATNEISSVNLPRTLYVLWAGGQEYLVSSSVTASVEVTAFLNAVHELLILGIEHLMIINVPPLQLYPGVVNNRSLEALITEHNILLASNLTQMQTNYPKTALQLFDVHALLTGILTNSTTYGLNTVDACWNVSDATVLSQCANANQYVFVDGLHFSSTIHQMIADQIQRLIASAGLTSSSSSKVVLALCTFLFLINSCR